MEGPAEYSDVLGLAADAVGEPGSRTFLLQLYGEWGRHTYLLEKGQVAALAAAAVQLMKETGMSGDEGVTAPLLIDELPRFRVGQLALGWDEATDTVLLTLESVADDDDPVKYRMSMDVLAAAGRQGEQAVASGRPRCERCGLAIDADGHPCPTSNGDLRHHQP